MEAKNSLMHRCKVIDKTFVARDCFRLILHAPTLTRAEPGQFIHLRAGASTDPLLRRPFSIHYVHEQAAEIWLLIRVVGTVTASLSRMQPGEVLDLLGPLGNSFPEQDEAAKVILVAGGIGLAPLFFLARRRRESGLPFDYIIGGAGGSSLPADTYFSREGLQPLLATEDGCRGYKGTAVDLLRRRLESEEKPACIYACGPIPMLAGVVETGRCYGIPTYISLESLMACAVGACLGCAFPFRTNGSLEYRRVCRDGPVFRGEEACFDHVCL